MRTVLAAQTTMLVGLGICLLWAGVAGRLTLWVLLLPVLFATQVMLLIGAACFLAPIYVVFATLAR